MYENHSFPSCDRRQLFLAKMLTDSGYHVTLAENIPPFQIEASQLQDSSDQTLFLLPIPAPNELLTSIKPFLTEQCLVLGGHIPESFVTYCRQKKIRCIDYLTLPTLSIANAVATAEGAICQAIIHSSFNLHNSPVLIIGYGKCGEVLAHKLQGLRCHVTISTRDQTAQARAVTYGYSLLKEHDYSPFSILFNTAPAMVITKDVIDQLQKDAVIIDIASRPGGTDFNYAIQKGITAKHCPGLPGKYSPKTSAEIIFQELLPILENS